MFITLHQILLILNLPSCHYSINIWGLSLFIQSALVTCVVSNITWMELLTSCCISALSGRAVNTVLPRIIAGGRLFLFSHQKGAIIWGKVIIRGNMFLSPTSSEHVRYLKRCKNPLRLKECFFVHFSFFDCCCNCEVPQLSSSFKVAENFFVSSYQAKNLFVCVITDILLLTFPWSNLWCEVTMCSVYSLELFFVYQLCFDYFTTRN